MRKCALLSCLLASASLFAADNKSPDDKSAEGTRQLYYLHSADEDPLPPIAPATANTPAPPKAAVKHLGLRYSIVLLTDSGRREQHVSADRILLAGNCFAIDLEANRSGYLYVFAKQSSGSWHPLLPSAEMPGESNVLDPGKKTRIPGRYCFKIENPPGQETLFVVLSRDPRDFYELYEGFKGKSGGSDAGGRHAASNPELAQAGKLDSAVDHLDEKLSTRDISIAKVETPKDKNEPADAVYVVNASDQPAASIVTKIIVRHR